MSKRNRRNSEVATILLHAAMAVMWYDVHHGKDATKINTTKYSKKYNVSNFGRDLVLPYITQEQCPTLEQARKFRELLNEYNELRKHIEFIKRKGYTVLKIKK